MHEWLTNGTSVYTNPAEYTFRVKLEKSGMNVKSAFNPGISIHPIS